MTNEKKPKTEHYDTFMKSMEELSDLAKIQDGLKDQREEIRKKAGEKQRKYAFSIVELIDSPQGLVPGQAKPKKAKDMTAEDIKAYVQAGNMLASDKATKTFYDNLDAIVDEEIPQNNLEKLVATEEIIGRASGKQRKVLETYAGWQMIKQLRDNYESGKDISSEDEKHIKVAAAKGIGSAVSKSLAERGYSEDIAEMVGELVTQSAAPRINDVGKLKKYALPGLDELAKKAKEDYEKLTENSKKAEDIGRGILKKMAKGSREDFEKAYGLVYSAGKKE